MSGSLYGNGWSGGAAAMVVSDQFPAGLRVLVVDDDASCLKIIDKMLRRLMYQVTLCSQANVALAMLRERKGCFDLVLSDVHMPGMDGYKLLEHVGLEMDLPVIMMSADGRTSTVMTGINHGACDYLIKPIRLEALKNIWQHVVRKKWNMNKDHPLSAASDDTDPFRGRNDISDTNTFSVTESSDENSKHQRKRCCVREDDDEMEKEDLDSANGKKPRVVWSVELHQQFVSAVNHLGIDKAVPKRILELMNVPGLTRENVASHLQKFRLYLKRLSGVAPQSSASNALCNNTQSNLKIGSLGRCDIQTLTASRQIHPQTLAALFGRPVGDLDQPTFIQPTFPGPKCLPVGQAVTYGHPVLKCMPSDASKHFQHPILPSEDLPVGFGAWLPNENLGSIAGNGSGNLNSQNENYLVDMSQTPNPMISVQSSCFLVPSLSPNNCFGTINSPASVNQSIVGFNSASMFDHSVLSAQGPHRSLACSVNTGNNNSSSSSLGMQMANNNEISAHSSTRGAESNNGMDHIPMKYLGFANDEMEWSLNNLDHRRTFESEKIIKQEVDVDPKDIPRSGPLILQHFPSNELMSVFTK